MKLCIGVFVLAAIGCSGPNGTLGFSDPSEPPKDPFRNNSPAGLPRLKLVRVIDGSIVQIGPSNQLIISKKTFTSWTFNHSTMLNWRWNLDTNMPTTGKIQFSQNQLWVGDLVTSVTGNSYLDETGRIQQFSDTEDILITDGGKKVLVTPMLVATTTAKYYQGNLATYICDNKTGEFRKVYEHQGSIAGCIAKGDILFCYEWLVTGDVNVVRLSPTQPARVLFKGNCNSPGQILNVSSDEKVTIMRDFLATVIDRNGKATDIEPRTSELAIMNYKQHQYQFGFARAYSPDKTKWTNKASVWNKDGQPVRLLDLCPELKDAMVQIKEMTKGTIVVNDAGMVAIECSGHNLLPGKTDIDYSSNASKVNKTYVFQVIDDN